jgi:hypothetical protein
MSMRPEVRAYEVAGVLILKVTDEHETPDVKDLGRSPIARSAIA